MCQRRIVDETGHLRALKRRRCWLKKTAERATRQYCEYHQDRLRGTGVVA